MSTLRKSLRLSVCWGALVVMLATSTSSCTFVFDNGATQCDVDSDCQNRGFANAVCDRSTNTCLRQCGTTADCEARGFVGQICNATTFKCEPPPEPKWACLDGFDPVQTTGDLIEYKLQVVNAATRSPSSDVKVRACSALDPTCAMSPTDYQTAVSGVVTLSLPDNFRGYFEAVGTAEGTYAPQLVYFPTREIARGLTGRRLLMFPYAVMGGLMEQLGASFELDQLPNALLIASALDCESKTTAGITFSLPADAPARTAGTKEFYTNESQLPTLGLTETNATGTYGLSNLNPGSVTILANVNPLNRPLVDEAATVVRNNWITVVFVTPP